MYTRQRSTFSTVHTEGALLPADLLARVIDRDRDLAISEADYNLVGTTRLNEQIGAAWGQLQVPWANFQKASGESGDTRKQWLLPLFAVLGYGRLFSHSNIPLGDRLYPISNSWGNVPIHLLGKNYDLDDRTAGVVGAARTSPHSLVQDFLNRSDDHLWGFVSNGRKLRLLRDNLRLSSRAYVEFDLEAIMSDDLYPDFALLWMLTHQSRLEPRDGGRCRLEDWVQVAKVRGTRALDHLRVGVEQAITVLGQGFVSHLANVELLSRLRGGGLKLADFYHQLLLLVYRLIFLLVAEDRDLLLDPAAPDAAREIYVANYSVSRLRQLAGRIGAVSGRHADLYAGLVVMLQTLEREGCPALALGPLGGPFRNGLTPDLDMAALDNQHLLEAVAALAYTNDGTARRVVDYKNLNTEELGSIYEGLLELQPRYDGNNFRLGRVAGNERKTSGSFYTHPDLVNQLLDTALDPVVKDALDGAQTKEGKIAALLALKVCDPSCGSGHFLVGAARRLALHLARLRTGDEEPAPRHLAAARREVITNCIYGIDKNPMAVELCKVALWMEAMEPGKPLDLLDHHIQCGNSLFGATPRLLKAGVPETAFAQLTGDNREEMSRAKKQNKKERPNDDGSRQTYFNEVGDQHRLEDERLAVEQAANGTVDEVTRKEQLFYASLHDSEYRRELIHADAWCAAFVWPRLPGVPYLTDGVLRRVAKLGEAALAGSVVQRVGKLAAQYKFFHWHLAFPDVFKRESKPENEAAGWSGGFDVVLGNAPWEHIELKKEEWFSAHGRSDISEARNDSVRNQMIDRLKDERDSNYNPDLYNDYLAETRSQDGFRHFLANSGRFPLCGRGRINTYSVFAETDRLLVASSGQVGCVTPSGIATDDTTKDFFRDLVVQGALVSLYDFENSLGLFAGVHRSYKFCLLTLAGSARKRSAAEFVFFAHKVEDLKDEQRRFSLNAAEIDTLNPNTGTAPIFRSQRDAALTKAIYANVPVLIREADPERGWQEQNPWGVTFMQGLFNMATASGLFRTRPQLERDGWRLRGNRFEQPTASLPLKEGATATSSSEVYLPLYEAKMIHQFDHRFASYEGAARSKADEEAVIDMTAEQHADPDRQPLPRYWVASSEVDKRLAERWDRGWLLGWRDIARATDQRTMIVSLIPRVGVGHKAPLILSSKDAKLVACLQTNLNSFMLDFVARRKIGGTSMSYFIVNQLPILPPSRYAAAASWTGGKPLAEWLLPRVLELTYTAWDLQPFGIDCGLAKDAPPFRWDEARRFLLRCELDAAYFHLYLRREKEEQAGNYTHADKCADVAYIMDSFPIVRRKDEERWGSYRTKETILTIFDAMARAEKDKSAYITLLDPPPADPLVAHPPRESR